MIPSVFISYASKSEKQAKSLAAVLRGLGCKTIAYSLSDRTSAVDADTLTKIRKWVSSSSLFVQVLAGHAGSILAGSSTPVLQQECDWFLEERAARGHKRPLPLILSYSPETTGEIRSHFEKYISWLAEKNLDFTKIETDEQLIEVFVGWFERERLRPPERVVIEGFLDVEVAKPGIEESVRNALQHNTPIPQKLLYTSPIGAHYWMKLCKHQTTSVRRLYDVFKLNDLAQPFFRQLLLRVAKWPDNTPISIVALGSGDGRRECMVAEGLASAFVGRPVRVLLVDVSKTLLASAAAEFMDRFENRSTQLSMSFAVADLEHPHALTSLMMQWSHHTPAVVLFLGNTLGNMDLTSFLVTLSQALKPEDVVLCEVGIANEKDVERLREGKGTGWSQVPPQHDDRFDFVSNPLRAFGIRPMLENYRARTQLQETSVQRIYAYQLSDADAEILKPFAPNAARHQRLQLLQVDAFVPEALLKQVAGHIRVMDNDIQIAKSNVEREGFSTRMGIFVATVD